MNQEAVFDCAAHGYDHEFTFTPTGQLMRDRVREMLRRHLPAAPQSRVLEVNCGTGEDSLWIAGLGYQVTGTDLSGEMIRVASGKSRSRRNVHFQKLGFGELEQLQSESPFDGVFSNFGGLNCVDESTLRQFACTLSGVMKPGAQFVAVVMPRFCLWETQYFLAKFKWKQAFRRLRRDAVMANVSGRQQPTWYYSPRQFKSIFDPCFKMVLRKPVGIALPPSYLDPFFSKRPRLLHTLNSLEKLWGRMPLLAGVSDHFLMVMERKA